MRTNPDGARVPDDDLPEQLYHATFLGRLPGIQAEGLVPGGRSQFGSAYATHSAGRVFLTDAEGVSFWLSKMEEIASNSTDFDDESWTQWMPVLIAVDILGDDMPVFVDPLGTRDAGGALAVYVEEPLSPDLLSVWDGVQFIQLEDADAEEIHDLLIAETPYEHEGGYYEADLEALTPPEEAL